ncbi:MAG: response regulator [Oscillospiraceae bacterium]|nr:response regulator [Oscillospiraceae bacterium]
MIRVVIADDEQKVSQLIVNLVDWAAMDMHVVGIAQNGIEAVELVKNENPDILITDIRMPGYDGLELIRRAKDVNQQLDIIIVSGYRYFDYAQTAIKYGVSDYILKPINQTQITTTLQTLREKYMLRTQQLSEREALSDKLKSAIDKTRLELFDVLAEAEAGTGTTTAARGGTVIETRVGIRTEADVTAGAGARAGAGTAADITAGAGTATAVIKGMSLVDINNKYDYNLQPGCFQFCVLKIDGDDASPLTDDSMSVLMGKCNAVIRETLADCCYDMEIRNDASFVFILLNYSLDARESIRVKMLASLNKLRELTGMFAGVEFTIALGSVETEPDMLWRSYRSAYFTVMQRLVIGGDSVLNNAYKSEFDKFDGYDFVLAAQKAIEKGVELLDGDAVAAALDDFSQKFIALGDATGAAKLVATGTAKLTAKGTAPDTTAVTATLAATGTAKEVIAVATAVTAKEDTTGATPGATAVTAKETATGAAPVTAKETATGATQGAVIGAAMSATTSAATGEAIVDSCRRLFEDYLILLRKYDLNTPDTQYEAREFRKRIELCATAEKAFGFTKQFILRMFADAVERRRDRDSRPIRAAKQFINENYMKPITLEDVSESAGFNASYFSYLFKKETGQNYLEYVAELRVNKAKELLRETGISVADICTAVGYVDIKHFSHIFKKITGINPREFRKLYS